jgi:hypothetical protein
MATEIAGNRVVLTGRKIHCLRCMTGEESDGGRTVGGVFVTDERADTSGWYEILDVSDRCRLFDKSHIGSFIWLNAYSVGTSYKVGTGERVVREEWFEQNGGPPLMVVKG